MSDGKRSGLGSKVLSLALGAAVGVLFGCKDPGEAMIAKSGCEAVCALLEECSGPLTDGLAVCVSGCEDELALLASEVGELCSEKNEEIYRCWGALECQEYRMSTEMTDDPANPCAAELKEGQDAC